MSPAPRPPRAFAVLSGLLLVTGLALLGAAMHAPARHGRRLSGGELGTRAVSPLRARLAAA